MTGLIPTTQRCAPACAHVDERDGERQSGWSGAGIQGLSTGGVTKMQVSAVGHGEQPSTSACCCEARTQAWTMPEEGTQGPEGSQGSCASVSQSRQQASKLPDLLPGLRVLK